MKFSPQLKLTIALVILQISIILVADLTGVMPSAGAGDRESRKMLGESLAVQLSSAAQNDEREVIEQTLRQLVQRNPVIVYGALVDANERPIAEFGARDLFDGHSNDLSSLDSIQVPIMGGAVRWGEARLAFAPSKDPVLRYTGISTEAFLFMFFVSLLSFGLYYLFLRKALIELNPNKAVPQRVNSAFNVLAEGVLVIDEKERVVLANETFARMVGEDAQRLVGKLPSEYQWDLSGEGLETLPWQIVLQTGERVTGMPLKLDIDGRQRSLNVNAAPIDDGRGQSRGVLVTFDDVTPIEAKNRDLADMLEKLSNTQHQIEQKNRELERLASVDPLTGSLNRRSFLAGYEQHFEQARASGGSMVVMMMDIDHFKAINDNYGHGVGDQAIRAMAEVLNETIAGRGLGLVGRYGGEEFVAVLPGAEIGSSLKLAENIRLTIGGLAGRGIVPVDKMTVSVGVAALDRKTADSASLVDEADQALYVAKESGRDRVCLFDRRQTKISAAQTTEQADDYTHNELKTSTDVLKLKEELASVQQRVKEQALELTRRSMYDEVTGLPNRFLFQDRLSQAMSSSSHNGTMTAVISIGLSAYRAMSDMLGYQAAEEMVRGAALRVETAARSLVGKGISFNEHALTCSRTGESELSVLIVDFESVTMLPKLVDWLSYAVEKPFQVDGQSIVNEVSCGVAVFPNDGNEPDLLLRNASLARAHAERRSPRSGVAYFCQDIDKGAEKNRAIAADLVSAIRNDQLDVVYQPKVDASTERVAGVEALARWSHPDLGPIGPLEFITIAESIGVISQLTDWVWGRVADDIAAGRLGDLPVSVNVSPIELFDPATADRLLNIIRSRDLAPDRFEIEITESSILDNLDMAKSILKKLKDAGVLIVLDDFGTEYSSLNLLLEIPVDLIKIDRSFVSGLHERLDNRAVVEGVVHMADAMGKRVVAEGVEVEAERNCLIEMGCHEMQGYFYSKPMAVEELVDFVASRTNMFRLLTGTS